MDALRVDFLLKILCLKAKISKERACNSAFLYFETIPEMIPIALEKINAIPDPLQPITEEEIFEMQLKILNKVKSFTCTKP